jgi:hypothetical protein
MYLLIHLYVLALWDVLFKTLFSYGFISTLKVEMIGPSNILYCSILICCRYTMVLLFLVTFTHLAHCYQVFVI